MRFLVSLALNVSFKFLLKGAVPERMNFNASCAVFRFRLFLVCQCIEGAMSFYGDKEN